jgi:hypothetical protein
LKFKGNLRFLEKKCHNYLLVAVLCMDESFPCSL